MFHENVIVHANATEIVQEMKGVQTDAIEKKLERDGERFFKSVEKAKNEVVEGEEKEFNKEVASALKQGVWTNRQFKIATKVAKATTKT